MMSERPERVGIYICHCGFNIGGVIDIPTVMNHFSNDNLYPDVTIVDHEYFCSDAGLIDLKAHVKDHAITRIVIAACSLKLHGELFKGIAADSGINKYLVEFANIREQNSWVHVHQPRNATTKAIDQINMALAKVRLAIALETLQSPVEKSCLVVGGGVAGIKAALAVADAGFKTTLVERQPTIGGHMALFDKTFPTLDCSICVLGPEMVHVKNHPNITMFTHASITGVSGHSGSFTVSITRKARFIKTENCAGCFDDCCNPCPVDAGNAFYPRKAIYVPYPQAVPLFPVIDMEACIHCRACELGCQRDAIDFTQQDEQVTITAGTIIVATGFEAFDPTVLPELGYGTHPDIITGMEMERLLNPHGPTGGAITRPSDGATPGSIAYVLCVGARDEKIGNPWCSRVCCNYATKQAVQLVERVPGARVSVFYTDLRATGKGCEEFLNRSRTEFKVSYTRGRVSRVLPDDGGTGLIIEAEDTLVQRPVEQKVDLVVLATAMSPPRDTKHLAQVLNIATGSDGFFLEDHLKMRPSQSTIKGIFLAGVAQGPKDIPESIAQAESAASKAIAMMVKGFIETDPRKIAYIQERCVKCKLCTRICSFGALSFVDDRVEVSKADCTGCGACQAMCPSNALYIPGFTKDEILNQIESVLAEKHEDPTIIAFLCNWCSYAGADLAGTAKMQYPSNVRTIHVMCSAMVDPLYIFTAFARGADGVLVAGCYEQDCHYNTGFVKTKTRTNAIKELLGTMNIDPRRLVIDSVSAGEGKKYQELVTGFVSILRGLINSSLKDKTSWPAWQP